MNDNHEYETIMVLKSPISIQKIEKKIARSVLRNSCNKSQREMFQQEKEEE